MKALWIPLGIYISANALWANCTLNGTKNDTLNCTDVKSDSDSYSYELKQDNVSLKGSGGSNTLSVSDGNLTLTFAQNVSELIANGLTFNISGGTTSVNYDSNSNNMGSLNLQGNANLNVSGGTFQSNVIVNNAGNGNATQYGIKVSSSGTFTAGMLSNNGYLALESSGKLDIKTLENKSKAEFKGGNSDIKSLLNNANNANLTISSGTHKIDYLSNLQGTTTISGGTNTITTLSNTANLTISGGTKNEITDLRNTNGTATISGGTNNITNLSNSANLNISGGTNTITAFSNTKGVATISGGTNNITELVNTANLTLKNGGNTTIKTMLYNSGTLDLQSGANLKLDSSANLYNYGTLSGGGTISGGIFNHYGTFSNFTGTFNGDMTFNNHANLTIKNSGGSGDLANLSVKSFGNYYANSASKLTLESTITTQGFTNGILATALIKGTLTINGGTATIKCDDKSDNYKCNGDSNKTYTISLVAQNAGGFFTLESGGKVDSKIDFSNTGYLTINGGEFNVNSKALKNEGNGVIALKDGTIRGSVENISGSFNMSGGTIENTLKNNGNFTLSGGTISGAITNEGGNFSINGGTTSATFTNKVREIENKDKDDKPIGKDYKGANLIILGSATIATLTNQSQSDSSGTKYSSVISIEGGALESENLTNAGLIQAIRGSLSATKLLNNNGGSITAYSGGSITAQSFQWGNGIVNYINGNNGNLNLNNITITANQSTLNMDFSLAPLVFGAEYKVIKSDSSPTNLNQLTIISNVQNNLSDSTNLKFTTKYDTSSKYIIISTAIDNANAPLRTLLSASALQTLGETTNQLDALKRIDNSEVLSNIISNPARVATELQQSNATIATNHTKNSHLNLATSLNTLNRLNKHATPKKLAFSDMVEPNYRFSLNTKKPKNPLIRFANFSDSSDESTHSSSLRDLPLDKSWQFVEFANEVKQPSTNINWIASVASHPRNDEVEYDESTRPSVIAREQGDRSNLENRLPRFYLVKSRNDEVEYYESIDDSATFTLEDLRAEQREEMEAAKLKYNQLLDYENNLYASIFGIFGDFGGIKTNAYGLVAGYDTKIGDRFIVGANLSYANVSKAHNIGVGGYGRAFVLNNEIDFGLNLNYALTEYATQMLGNTQSAKFSSFGLSANVEYGYLFNVYKTQFFKPFGGLNLYYATTPSYAESGKYAHAVDSQHSVEMSLDLGAEYRLFLKKYYYLFAQIRFEQFVLNASNGLNMSFVGDSEKFEFSKYKGYKNYLQFLVGGDFAVIKNALNITANVGYKMTIAKSSVETLGVEREIGESYISASVGVKYYF